MDENRPTYGMKAPGATSSARSYDLPSYDRPTRSVPRVPRAPRTPRVDDHHHPDIQPEISRNELIGGVVMEASPAKLPHGMGNFDLDYLVAGHLAEGYRGATDLITHFDDENDFASDTAILKEGIDPATGTRYLEEIAFEVVSEQNQAKIDAKAQVMTRRGVRRVFAVFVKRGEVREWKGGAWKKLSAKAVIKDRCLAAPLPVAAILDAAGRDDAVAEALFAKGNRVTVDRMARQKADGKAEGKAEAIFLILEQRNLSVSAALRRRILACTDHATLDRCLARSFTALRAEDLIQELS